jgi:hypothetical protein
LETGGGATGEEVAGSFLEQPVRGTERMATKNAKRHKNGRRGVVMGKERGEKENENDYEKENEAGSYSSQTCL